MSPSEAPYLDRFAVSTHRRSSRRPNHSRRRKATPEDLKALLQEATWMSLTKPDLALNLEIADVVNELGSQAPQIVCKHVLSYVNFFRGITSMLALSVLDVCVKNCGYRFHLAIASKEFLNKLVRSFSYRPPVTQTSMETLILEMIEEWNLTLAKTSVYRDDMANIRDMHRLLTSRGYVFPKIKSSELMALTAENSSLKSAAELEREEHERQSVKMQMLLNSKNPEDLKEANRLMSLLSGYREPQVDYKAKVAADLDKLRRTKELLSSAVGEIKPGVSDDVFDELAVTLKGSLPKLKVLLKGEASEEEDSEAYTKVKQLYEEIKAVLEQYTAAIKGEPVPQTSVKGVKGDSLIDIDGDEQQNDDLLALSSLSLSNTNILEINARQGQAAPAPAPQAKSTSANLLDIFDSPAVGTSAALSAGPSAGPSLVETSFEPATSTASTIQATPSANSIWKDEAVEVSYVAQKPSPNSTVLTLQITNIGSKKITGLETQLAQPKSLTMELGALSQTQLNPNQNSHQRVVLNGESAPKLRWKALFNYGLDKHTANGDIKAINA